MNLVMSEASVFERAVQLWEDEEIPLLPRATEDEIRDVFASFGAVPTADVIQLYGLMGGFPDGVVDQIVWSLWSLERIRELNQEHNPDPSYVWFADFLVDSVIYGLRPETSEVSSVWLDSGSYHEGPNSNEPPLRLAPTLSDFLNLYLTQPEEIWITETRGAKQRPETARQPLARLWQWLKTITFPVRMKDDHP